MSTQVAPSSSPEASTSLSKPKAPTKRPRASSISGGKGKAKDESPGLGGADDGDGSAAEGGKKAKKGKNAKGAGPGKGWRAGRGGGSTGKRTRKKVRRAHRRLVGSRTDASSVKPWADLVVLRLLLHASPRSTSRRTSTGTSEQAEPALSVRAPG